MRLIDADDILPMMERKMDMQDLYLPIHFQEMVIDEMPTVDAVRVVRCGQCSHSEVCKMDEGDVRYCHIFEMQTEDDYYCADGESLEEDDLLTSANHDGERKVGEV